jgi:hypothetical protein
MGPLSNERKLWKEKRGKGIRVMMVVIGNGILNMVILKADMLFFMMV